VVIYYLIYIYFSWSFARHLKADIEKHADHKKTRSFNRICIGKVSQTHRIQFGSFGKAFEALRLDCTMLDLCLPIALVVRNLLLAIFIVLLSDHPHVTPIMTVLTELSFLAYCLITRSRAKRLENTLDAVQCCCRIAYGVMAAITFAYDEPPNDLDITMFLTLLALTFLNLFFTAYIIILTVYDALVEGKCDQTFHEERYEHSKSKLYARLEPYFARFRSEALQMIERKPIDFHQKVVKGRDKDPRWVDNQGDHLDYIQIASLSDQFRRPVMDENLQEARLDLVDHPVGFFLRTDQQSPIEYVNNK
jgi:hypothetical protein